MPFSLDPQPRENEIECAACGALIYDQLSRCPNCGVNLYEPEEDEDFGSHLKEISDKPVIFQKLDAIFHKLFKKPYSAEEVFGDSLNQAFYYNDLLQKVAGDHAVVERLIEHEQSIDPRGTRIRWLKEAIRRWEKDNRSSSKTDE